MRICIFGAGSLGSALGGLLARSNEVTLIGRKDNVTAIRERGLRVTGRRRFTVKVAAYDAISGITPPELLIIATKAYNTRAVVEACEGWLSGDALVLTLQNGLGNLEIIRAWRSEMAFGGTTTMGAFLVKPGSVRLAGIGKTVIGSDRNPSGAGKICGAFTASEIPTSVSSDITGEIWAKAIVNASINPLTAILRVRNGELLASPSISRMMEEVCRECETVASKVGISMVSKTLVPHVRAVARETSGNISSMLQDVNRGRRTEIREINGFICEKGRSLGVSTPLNDSLVAMVEALERVEKG